ncbi:MAG: glycerol-3-phosphate 1-O-acyltransferase PlsY [Hydrogenophilus sp.]|nr:glycerol-3-phosphate 1-O-acyltransferase PlsY [Hydrogenophilus sp.]
MTALATVIGGYLLGAIPFALLISRLFALPDPRTYGSRNPGATNVFRTGHKIAALLTLLGDTGKGAAAVLLAQAFSGDPTLAALAGLSAFFGHIANPFLRFRGGKGVATALGVLLAIAPPVGIIAALIWLTVALLSRYSSLAALVAALLTPAVGWLISLPGPQLILITLMAAVLIARHHPNIRRLLAGTEPKIGRGH